jgi:hypothetical protein
LANLQRLPTEYVEATGKLNFDYGKLPSPVAKFLKGQADRIRRQCVTSIIQIGKALIEAKRHVSHGAFLEWVEAEVCLPARTAQAYMRVAGWASGKGATVAYLSPSILYLLSSSSTPQDFVQSILARVEAGEDISVSRLRVELKQARAALQQSGTRDEAVRTLTSSFPLQHEGAGDGYDAMVELVSILVHGLQAADLERIQSILKGDVSFTSSELVALIEGALSPERSAERPDLISTE